MKKASINALAIIGLCFLFAGHLPWWSSMLAAFIVGFSMPLKRSANFWISFLSGALYVLIHAFALSHANDFILARKMTVLFSLGQNIWLLFLISALIGGLSAGVSGAFGKECRGLYSKKQTPEC